MVDLEPISRKDAANVQSWTEAHDLCCTRRRSFLASPQDVFDELYKEGDDIAWELPRKDEVIAVEKAPDADALPAKAISSLLRQHVAEAEASEQQAGQGSGAFSYFRRSKLTSTVSTLYKAVVGLDSDLDDAEGKFQQEGDDAVAQHVPDDEDDEANRAIMSTAILNVGLAAECVELLVAKMKSMIDEEEPLVLLRNGDGPGTWRHWCATESSTASTKGDTTAKKVLANLSQAEMDILLRTMVEIKKAHAMSRPNNPDMVVLTPKECTDPSKVDMHVALYDIDVAERVIEERLANLSGLIKASTNRALQHKKTGNRNKALMELKHRKLLSDRQEISQNQILKLEETRSALVHSSNTKEVVETLSSTASTMRLMRESKQAENAGMVSDLNKELNHVQDVDPSFAGGVELDEEELMEELSVLSSPAPTKVKVPERDLDEAQRELQKRLDALQVETPKSNSNSNSKSKQKSNTKKVKSKLKVAVTE